MKLIVCEDTLIINNPSNAAILQGLEYLDEETNPAFAILEINEMTYLQVSGDKKGGFRIEYQEGEIDKHYAATRKTTLNETVNIFTCYRDNNRKWRLICPIHFKLGAYNT